MGDRSHRLAETAVIRGVSGLLRLRIILRGITSLFKARLYSIDPQRSRSPTLLTLAVVCAMAPSTLLADESIRIEDRLVACQRPPLVFARTPSDTSELCRDWSTPPKELRPYSFQYATIDDVMKCLEGGADPNATTELGGWKPLHGIAGYNGNPAILGALLAAGADPNGRDSCERTPLHHAAITGLSRVVGESPNRVNIERIILALIEGGADPDARASDGYTPLHQASFGRDAIVLSALLKNGGKPKCPRS